MERISRALELARAQRDARSSDAQLDPQRTADVKFETKASVVEQIHDATKSSLDRTTAHQLPTIQLDPVHQERERIVAPGCVGAMGAPYKMLRTQVLKRMDQLGSNTLAVLSGTSGAGKTLTAINLAIAISADPGRTALLVDFDLRNPCIARRLGFVPEVGVEECLANGRSVHEAMVKIEGYDRLRVLPARERVAQSSELLHSRRTVDIFMELRARYANRVLVFDLPPVLQADDALAFSKLVQAGLVVVGERRSRREDITRTIELLHELPIVGTVLNGSRDDSRMVY